MKEEPKYADKTKVILSGTSTVAEVEARMQKVLEEEVLPIVKKWDEFKRTHKNIKPNYNTPKPF